MAAISASQLKAFRDCERQWWFDKVNPQPRSGGEEAAQLGQEVHAIAEAYHKHGRFPDRETKAGAIFMPALPWLPRPGVGKAEGEFTRTLRGVVFRGYIDLECITEAPRTRIKSVHIILDYKTCKNFRYALKGPGDFLNDPQALVYAMKALRDNQETEYVLLRWLYLRTEGKPKAMASDCMLSRAEICEAFDNLILPMAKRLVQIKLTKPNPLTLKPNPATCHKYERKGPDGTKIGACAYITKCNLTLAERLSEMNQGEEDMSGSLLSDLEAKFGPAKGINPPEGKKETALTLGNVKLMPSTSDLVGAYNQSTEAVVGTNTVAKSTGEPTLANLKSAGAGTQAVTPQLEEEAELGRALICLFKAFKGA